MAERHPDLLVAVLGRVACSESRAWRRPLGIPLNGRTWRHFRKAVPARTPMALRSHGASESLKRPARAPLEAGRRVAGIHRLN